MRCKSSMEKPIKHRKGLWSPEEDQRLRDYVLNHGHGCWSSVPINAGLQRNGKSCRLRWINYLRPGLKRGMFTLHEEETILRLHRMLGNKWSQIAQQLPGRTDNEIKNYWHSYLKKKLAPIEVTKSEETETPLSQNPTPVNALPKILFAEWLTLDDNNSFNRADTFSAFDHSPVTFCENGGGTMASKYGNFEDIMSGDGGFEGRNNGNFEDIMSGSSYYCGDMMYGNMEYQMLEKELLELVSINNGVYSSGNLI